MASVSYTFHTNLVPKVGHGKAFRLSRHIQHLKCFWGTGLHGSPGGLPVFVTGWKEGIVIRMQLGNNSSAAAREVDHSIQHKRKPATAAANSAMPVPNPNQS